MKGLFPGYYPPTDQELSDLWKDCIFVLDANANVVCKYSEGNSGAHSALKNPTSVFTQNDGKICFAINTKGRILSEDNTLFSLLGLSKACIDFASLNTYNNVSINNNLFVAGGILSAYDGQSITEQGFHVFPEGLSLDSSPTTGGNMSKAAMMLSKAPGALHLRTLQSINDLSSDF